MIGEGGESFTPLPETEIATASAELLIEGLAAHRQDLLRETLSVIAGDPDLDGAGNVAAVLANEICADLYELGFRAPQQRFNWVDGDVALRKLTEHESTRALADTVLSYTFSGDLDGVHAAVRQAQPQPRGTALMALARAVVVHREQRARP